MKKEYQNLLKKIENIAIDIRISQENGEISWDDIMDRLNEFIEDLRITLTTAIDIKDIENIYQIETEGQKMINKQINELINNKNKD
ncbi:MAG: hypothetical protein QXD43_04855 [Candidatus Aenigmatarchaeota archaeon]